MSVLSFLTEVQSFRKGQLFEAGFVATARPMDGLMEQGAAGDLEP